MDFNVLRRRIANFFLLTIGLIHGSIKPSRSIHRSLQRVLQGSICLGLGLLVFHWVSSAQAAQRLREAMKVELIPWCEPGVFPDVRLYPYYVPSDPSMFPTDQEFMLAREWELNSSHLHPLECETVYFHSGGDSLPSSHQERIRRWNKLYFEKYHPADCYFGTEYTCRPVHEGVETLAEDPTDLTGRLEMKLRIEEQSRFVSTLQMFTLVSKGLIVQPGTQKQTHMERQPWLVYLKNGVFFANQSASVADVLGRVRRGLQANVSAETEGFGGDLGRDGFSEGDLLDGIDPLSRVAMIVSLGCSGPWPVDTSVQISQASRVSEFVNEAVTRLFEVPYVKPLKHPRLKPIVLPLTTNEDKVHMVLEEAFGVPMKRLRTLCRHSDIALKGACRGVHPVMVRSLRLTTTLHHRQLGPIARRVFRDASSELDPDGERTLMVVMCGSWFNAPVCDETPDLLRFRCGDFAGRFCNCSHDHFPSLVAGSEECRDVWPAKQLNVPDEHFTWGNWREEFDADPIKR